MDSNRLEREREETSNEIQGQIDFYKKYLKRVNKNLDIETILTENTDGILNGNILEFKLNINDLNATLFQTIKYLSSLRIKGKSIPKNILLVSINSKEVFLYNSEDYLKDIEQVYIGFYSKNNEGFVINNYIKKLNLNNDLDEEELIELLKQNEFTKIHIDEHCVVGWAERFFYENPNATKSSFIGDTKIIGEIRRPDKFKDFIYPYTKPTNVKFEYLMDKLNDRIQKKDLGAFYTPKLYVQKAIELVREAIKNVPKGNDYIILDRCAGTGNLQKLLSNEELSHCIVSTLEYYEYKVLVELLGDKVRHIIPPTEKEETFNNGLVYGANALHEEYVNSPIIKQYIDNNKCTIILFENPPYAETTGIEHQKANQSKSSSVWKQSFIVTKMKDEVKGATSNDLANAFIWSGFKYYLRQKTDAYILFSPIKYWKSQNLVNKEFGGGFGFNRKHFHTKSNGFISCIYWKNTYKSLEEIELNCFDIVNPNDEENQTLKQIQKTVIKRVYKEYSKYFYDKRESKYLDSEAIVTELTRKEKIENKVINQVEEIKKSKITFTNKQFHKDILGYIVADKFGYENSALSSCLLVAARYNGHGFYLWKDNFLEKLPFLQLVYTLDLIILDILTKQKIKVLINIKNF